MFRSLTNDRKYAKRCVASLSKFLARDKNVVPADPSGSDMDKIVGSYILMPEDKDYYDTFAEGRYGLHDACLAIQNCPHPKDNKTGLYRPLTFKETIEARVNSYKTGSTDEEKRALFDRWLWTVTGIAYKAKSPLFKIIPDCEKLITIPKGFNEGFMSVDYDKIQGSNIIEFNRTKANVKYDPLLTKEEIEKHPAWLAAVEGDVQLLKDYRDIVFSLKTGSNQLMGFYLSGNSTGSDIAQDALRALFVSDIDGNSNANGFNNLHYGGSFLLVAQPKVP